MNIPNRIIVSVTHHYTVDFDTPTARERAIAMLQQRDGLYGIVSAGNDGSFDITPILTLTVCALVALLNIALFYDVRCRRLILDHLDHLSSTDRIDLREWGERTRHLLESPPLMAIWLWWTKYREIDRALRNSPLTTCQSTSAECTWDGTADSCPMCAGEVCNLCGAGSGPKRADCEHDVTERHQYAERSPATPSTPTEDTQ
jgi:hypothetical protein